MGSPAARGTGTGRRLIDEIIAWAARGGASQLRLQVRPDNAPAIGLYERSGFSRAGSADGSAGNGMPVLVMTRPLRALAWLRPAMRAGRTAARPRWEDDEP